MKKMPRSFASYAKLEAANIVLVPGAAFALARPANALELAAMVLAAAAVAVGLLVGTLFWRGLDRRLTKADRASLASAVRFADRAEKPAILLVLLALGALAAAASMHGLTKAVIAAGVLTLLAALEYVNYYHRQLQHFDNWNDFRRLVGGGGLKRSHLARELAVRRRR